MSITPKSSIQYCNEGNEPKPCGHSSQYRKPILVKPGPAGILSILCVACGLLLGSLLRAQDWSPKNFSRIDWQPTRTLEGAKYVGTSACAKCHPEQARTQPVSPMGLALQPAQDSQVLRSHPRLTFRTGPFAYTIEREGDRVTYQVSDGRQTISEPVLAAFGLGDAGQTYLLQHQGTYYESRVSFFNDVQALDFTLGHAKKVPESLEDALGNKVSRGEASLCFACHSTASVKGTTLQLDNMIPGITCEGCHGPGGKHVAAVGAGEHKEESVFNPGKLAAGDLVEFCGSCHRGAFQVGMMGISGVQTVRFQPYRLTSSLCFSPQDRRISCLACHNPHQNRSRDAGFYDAKCLACHPAASAKPTAGHTGSACPVGKSLCTNCHMPKYALPGGHLEFTDHQIRVVRDKAFPD
jgi:cytochrome c554/c'-like protein